MTPKQQKARKKKRDRAVFFAASRTRQMQRKLRETPHQHTTMTTIDNSSISPSATLIAENKAMREAIKEAHDLIRWLIPNSSRLNYRTASAAVAKLQPFITP